VKYFNRIEQTPFEAQRREKRKTRFLFILLMVARVLTISSLPIGFVVCFNRIVESSENSRRHIAELNHQPYTKDEMIKEGHLAMVLGWIFSASVGAGFLLALFEWKKAGHLSLVEILGQIEASPPRMEDDKHRHFWRLVREVGLAIGQNNLKPVVVPTWGCNAFSVEDAIGNTAIGVTEGLLGRLDRWEMAGVVAHEAAHLANRDSRLATIACVLAPKLDLSEKVSTDANPEYPRENRQLFLLILINPFMWGYAFSSFCSRVLYFALARNRELLADAKAVQLTRNPMSLAMALQRLSGSYKGGLEIPGRFAPLFILNPKQSKLDEKTGFWADLFSAHPPVQQRLKPLLRWSRSGVQPVEETDDSSEISLSLGDENTRYMIYEDPNWFGPINVPGLLRRKTFGPQAWICKEGERTPCQVSADSFLLSLLPRPSGPGVCPRCYVRLRRVHIKGSPSLACPSCQGVCFSGDEFTSVLGRIGPGLPDSNDKKSWLPDITVRPPGDPFPAIACPRCGGKTEKLFYWGAVPVDRCLDNTCKALWLDDGELKLIVGLAERMRRRIQQDEQID